jgi:hypothetical protein
MRKRDEQPFSGVSIILEIVPHSDQSFLKINDINGNLFFGTADCHHCCSLA